MKGARTTCWTSIGPGSRPVDAAVFGVSQCERQKFHGFHDCGTFRKPLRSKSSRAYPFL